MAKERSSSLTGWGPAAEWRPIETAPKSSSTPTPHGPDVRGIYFLAYCPDEGVRPEACICICWWEPHMDGGKGRWQGEGDFPLRPTHWMPLPSPPSVGAPTTTQEGETP